MKRVKIFVLLLIGLLFSVESLVAQEGYWVLETMTYGNSGGHGFRCYNNDRHYNYERYRRYCYSRNYTTGEVRHWVPTISGSHNSDKPDPEWLASLRGYYLNPETDAEEIANNSINFTDENYFWLGKDSKFTWSEPPHKIKIGDERMVKMDAALYVSDYDEKNHSELGVEITMVRQDAGNYPKPDERDIIVGNYKNRIKISNDGERSVKNKPIWSEDCPLKVASDHMWYYTMDLEIRCGSESDRYITYHYTCVPNFTEVTTVASDEEGEAPIGGGGSSGGSGSNGGNGSHGGGLYGGGTTGGGGGSSSGGSVEIPWTYILIGVGAVAAGAIAIKGRGGNKRNPGKNHNNNNPKDESREETKPHSTFRMILYKDFGDTMMAGQWMSVGARIEEVTPQGQQIDRRDLTMRISIAPEEGCITNNTRMQGKYMMTSVTVSRNRDGSVPNYAKLKLTFTGPNGVLVNHVLFNVVDAPEIVIDNELTFEAEGGRTQYIEFGINNCSGTVLGANVTIDGGGDKYFTAKILPDGYLPNKFRINVTEKGKLPEGQAELREKPIAGDADRFKCKVSVNIDGRKEPVEAEFDIYRMYLGIRMDIRALKGYLVEYSSDYDTEVLSTDPEKHKKWGESKVVFKLYAADPETGSVNIRIPDDDPVFTFQDVKEGSVLLADRTGRVVQSVCDSMKFAFDLKDVQYDNTVIGVIHSTLGGLYPPNRAKAKVTVRASYKGQVYEASEIVAITSQPYRDLADPRAYDQTVKADGEKMRQLETLRRKIAGDPQFAELLPYYYKVDSMIKGYSEEFGFYEPDYEKLMRIFKKYCSGEIGHYFVNDAAWKPSWTEADENFNAFVATFGTMEKSVSCIVARIALGYFTAGASELVLTPFSAMVKMKQYVDKGGDSSWEAFKIASKDVLFWEGVFYVGGQLLKWTGGKAKEYLATDGGKKLKDALLQKGQKLKESYAKLKESVTGAKSGKEATKQLSNAKNFNAKELAEKVKEGGEKASQIQKSSAVKANEAIRKTRMKGDAVYTSKSQLMEECSKQARRDAQKALDEFKRVMNNPTATPDEMRRATMAIQGNKAAQNLLRESPSDLLRANFNAQMQKIYKEVDPLAIKKLAKKLGVPESQIQVAPNASGNSGLDLYLGKKIGADRDVTFQVRGKDGKWVDIQEDIMEQAYSEAFNEYHYGYMPADQQQALKTLHKFDQAVVNGETGLESYGKDLQNIINKDLQTSKLIDPEKVATTYEYKCQLWLDRGKECKERAEALFNAGYVDEAKSVMGVGESLIEEGIRQNVKQFKRILDPRIQELVARGVKGKDYSLLYEKIRVLEAIGVPPPKDVLPLSSVEEVRLVLQEQYHTTIEEVVKECASVIKEVNALL